MITSRAVTKVEDLLRIAENFLHEGLEILLYKGDNVYDEVKNIDNYEIIEKNNRKYLRLVI